MKNIVLACFAFVAMSCAQQKTVVQSQQVQNHRYTTVYEGNKIITYEKQEEKELTLSKREKVNVAADETVLILPKREKLEKLPVLAKRESQSRTNSTFSHNFKKSVISGLKQAKENSANADESTSSNMGFGLTGFILILGSGLLFIVGVVVAYGGLEILGGVMVLAAFAAIIIGIVMSILGIVKKKSQADMIFGIVGVSLIALSIVLSILGAVL